MATTNKNRYYLTSLQSLGLSVVMELARSVHRYEEPAAELYTIREIAESFGWDTAHAQVLQQMLIDAHVNDDVSVFKFWKGFSETIQIQD